MSFSRCGLAAVTLSLAWATASLAAPPASGQPAGEGKASERTLTPQEKAELERLRGIARNIHPVYGDVKLPGADATLRLGQDYYYVKPSEARTILVDAWRNPPDTAEDQLGLIFPKGGDFTDSWGAVVSFDKSGYVDDRDAKTTDYDKLLKQVQEAEPEENARRAKGGYPSINLVGWAQPPSYDAVHHSEIWAKDLKAGDRDVDVLNYDVRLLGRRGVLSLNLLTDMPSLAEARVAAKTLADHTSFDPGARYEDYKPGSDLKAAYTVGGMVAAGLGLAVAKKIGLLGLILLFAKKGIVLILAAFGGVAAWFRRMFGKGGRKDPPAQPPIVSGG